MISLPMETPLQYTKLTYYSPAFKMGVCNKKIYQRKKTLYLREVMANTLIAQ